MLNPESLLILAVVLFVGLAVGWLAGATVGHAAGRAKERREWEGGFADAPADHNRPLWDRNAQREYDDAQALRESAAAAGVPVTTVDRPVRHTPRRTP